MAESDGKNGLDGIVEQTPESIAELTRLTPEELAFLLGGSADEGPEQRAARALELRHARNARSNEARTERRRTDPAYAERLRAGDRDRQQRHRERVRETRPGPAPEPPVPLPPITPREAARRLVDYVTSVRSPQTGQLRRRPDLVRRYVNGFAIYQRLSGKGTRPTRGELADAFRALFETALSPSQVQNMRDQIEGFAAPGGPWAAGGAAGDESPVRPVTQRLPDQG